MVKLRVVVLSLALCQVAQTLLEAQAAPVAPARPGTQKPKTSLLGGNANSNALDLTSTATSSAGSILNGNQSANIRIGNSVMGICPTSLLTAGERLAAFQVITLGRQTIVLGQNGTAINGNFIFGQNLLNRVGSVTVPHGVTALAVFSQPGTTLSLSGNLNNYGSIYALASNTVTNSAALSATNIINNAGGLISSIANPFVLNNKYFVCPNLSLLAQHNLINNGRVLAAGDLSLTAGDTIVNGAASAGHPTLTALNSIVLNSPTFTNRGNVSAVSGNISVRTDYLRSSGVLNSAAGNISIRSTSSSLNVLNDGGRIQAGKNILFQTAQSSNAGRSALVVSGGILSAKTISFDAPAGTVNIFSDRIDGTVDANACTAEIGTTHGDLKLGSINLTGDPIFYALGGSLDLTTTLKDGFLTRGGDFVALANRNIFVNPMYGRSVFIDATRNAGDIPVAGGAITIAAGVNFIVVQSDLNCAQCSNSFKLLGQSSTGGSIFMPRVSLRTNGNGISLQAFAGKDEPGSIAVGGLETSGAGGGTNTLIEGINGQTAGPINVFATGDISTGPVRAYGGGGGGAFFGQGGAGGNGNTVSIHSLYGLLNIQGDVNTSGGGGGAGFAAQSVNGPLFEAGGAGGNGGNIFVSGRGVLVTGPLLAAGGGGGGGGGVDPVTFAANLAGGGGSFGGGGGGQTAGTPAGGGGIFGGGAAGTPDGDNGGTGGGGFFGGGGQSAGVFGASGLGGPNLPTAGFGQGGRGSIQDINSPLFTYKEAGSVGAGGDVGQDGFPAFDAPGGRRGFGGNIFVTGGSIKILQNVSSYYGSLPGFASLNYNPFSTSSIITTGPGQTSLVNIPTLSPSSMSPLAAFNFPVLTSPGLPGGAVPSAATTVNEILANKLPTDLNNMEGVGRGFLRATLRKNVAPRLLFAASTSAANFDAAEINRLSLEGVSFGPRTTSGFAQLDNGRLLFGPSQDITVMVREGIVQIPGGALVLIESNGKGTSIFSLHQSPIRSVRVIADRHRYGLLPGHLVVLTQTRNESMETIAPSLRFIAHRTPTSTGDGTGITSYFAEFSLPSALMTVTPLRELANSQNTNDRRLYDALLKDATILTDMTPSGRPYQRATSSVGQGI